MTEQEQQIVVRFHTLARKIPFLLGKMGDFAIPGGPYTLTQAVTFVVIAYLGKLTMPLWAAGWMPILAWIPVLLLAAACGFGIGRIPLKGRNPLLILLGVIGYVDAPTWGTQGGKDVELKKTRKIRYRTSAPTTSRLHVTERPEEGGELEHELADDLEVTTAAEGIDPTPVAGSEAEPLSAPAAPRKTPSPHQLDAVQQLLAASAQRR